MEQSAIGMGLVMLLAIVFIYLVLSAQFESFRDPAIILTIVPLAICGAIVGLFLFRGSYNLYSVIGFVALVGLIAKHGILIVEFTNRLRDQGRDLHDALIEASALLAGAPIVMTTTAHSAGSTSAVLGDRFRRRGACTDRHRHRRRNELRNAGVAVRAASGLSAASRTRRAIKPVPDLALLEATVNRHATD